MYCLYKLAGTTRNVAVTSWNVKAQTLKTRFSLHTGSRVETRRFQAMGYLGYHGDVQHFDMKVFCVCLDWKA
jgi:hypothetical protein